MAQPAMPAVVETRVMKCLQENSFRQICIPKCVPGKWSGFQFSRVLRMKVIHRRWWEETQHLLTLMHFSFPQLRFLKPLFCTEVRAPERVDYFSLSAWPLFPSRCTAASVSVQCPELVWAHSWPYVPAFVFKHFSLSICSLGIRHNASFPAVGSISRFLVLTLLS